MNCSYVPTKGQGDGLYVHQFLSTMELDEASLPGTACFLHLFNELSWGKRDFFHRWVT